MSAGQITQGRRIHDDQFSPGDYGLVGGVWHARAPRGHLGNLANHSVTEHEDGTITVSPSILITDGETRDQWHGFLEHGVWREA